MLHTRLLLATLESINSPPIIHSSCVSCNLGNVSLSSPCPAHIDV